MCIRPIVVTKYAALSVLLDFIMNLASVAGEPDRHLVFVSFNQDNT